MSTAENVSDDNTSLFDPDIQLFYLTQFWIMLGLIVPSLICALFALYHLLRDRALRQALYNHIIIVILLVNLFYNSTDMVLFVHYFRSYLWFAPAPIFRFIWGYIDYTFYLIQVALYAWVTIERHILIFHDHLLSTRKRRHYIHYLPPLIINVYCLIYYLVIFSVSHCENDFDSSITPALIPCAFENNALSIYETLIHVMLPVFIIVISSVILLFRAIRQRYHAQRQIQWRQYRTMTLQVLIVSSIYVIFSFPYILTALLHFCGISSNAIGDFLFRAMYCTYYTLFFIPIVTVGSLPELRGKVKLVLLFRRQRHVAPAMGFTNRHAPNYTVALR